MNQVNDFLFSNCLYYGCHVPTTLVSDENRTKEELSFLFCGACHLAEKRDKCTNDSETI